MAPAAGRSTPHEQQRGATARHCGIRKATVQTEEAARNKERQKERAGRGWKETERLRRQGCREAVRPQRGRRRRRRTMSGRRSARGRGGGVEENRADPATGGGATRWEGRLYTERGQERSVEEEWAHARRDRRGSSSLGRSTRASCFFLSALSSALGYLILCLG